MTYYWFICYSLLIHLIDLIHLINLIHLIYCVATHFWLPQRKSQHLYPNKFSSSNWWSPLQSSPEKWVAASLESPLNPPRRWIHGGDRFCRPQSGVCIISTKGKLGTDWDKGHQRQRWRRCGGWGGWRKRRELLKVKMIVNLMYLRGNFDRVRRASGDSESFHLRYPNGSIHQELNIFFFRSK